MGSLLGSVADMADDPGIQDLLEKLGGSAGTVEDIYVATEIHFVAAAVAAAGIALVLRLVGVRAVGPRRGRARRPRPAGCGGSAPTSRFPVALTAALMALLGAVVGLVGPPVTPEAPSLGAAVGRHRVARSPPSG